MSTSEEQDQLLLQRTKLYIPRVRDDLIPRPRLVGCLNRGLDRRLTLVCAPAGYGKTTLLAQWLADSQRPAAWLSLDENDNDVTLFLSYVVAAIQGLFPGTCPEMSSLLKAGTVPPQDYLETTLVNEISQTPEPFLLVLDDYHRIEDQDVHRMVTALAASRQRTLQLVLASRNEPPLPLARLRAGGKMEELRAEELRFTPGEAEAFLRTAVGMTLSDEAVDTLEERTEGWIAGLRLAALSLRKDPKPKDFVQRVKGTARDLADYLVAEVLAHQTVEVQDFLLKTSILDRFSAPLCDAVCFDPVKTADLEEERQSTLKRTPGDGGHRAGKPPPVIGRLPSPSSVILAQLERANMFLVSLDQEHGWYRYHHLFQDLLRHEMLVRASKQQVAYLYRRAGAWCAEQRLITEAVRYNLAGGDVLGATRLVDENWYEALNREDWRTLARWLGMLPEEAAGQRPGLLVARAWTIWFQFRLREIEPLLQKAEAGLNRGNGTVAEADERALRGAIDALRSYTWGVLHDNPQESLACAERALEQVPEGFAIGRGIALDFLCLAYRAMGRKEEAVRLLSEALDTPTLSGAARMQAFIALSLTYLLAGDLSQLQQTVSTFLDQSVQERQPTSSGWAHYLSGQLYYEWNDLEAAAQHFAAVADRRHSASFITVLGSMLGLARVRLAQGRPDQAEETVAMLQEHCLLVAKTASFPEIGAFQARLARALGDTATVDLWLRSFDPRQAREAFSVLYPPSLTRNRILIEQGSMPALDEAINDLQTRRAAAEETHNTRRVIQVLAHLALAYNALGQGQNARQTLEEAMVLARPGGFVRTFVDRGPEMATLLHQLVEQGVAVDYVGRVLAACSEESKIASTRRAPLIQGPSFPQVEPLTRRELQILGLIEQGLSNQEIARELVISPQTVKRHASNIYAKLGVGSRTKAVARAKNLGILSLN